MAKGFYRIPKGLEIDGNMQFINGTGIPGLAGDSTTVLVGSFYSDYTNAKFYKKILAGAGADKWDEIVDKTYVDSLLNGTSWREPGKVLDATAYANIAAAETAANVGDMIDSIVIASGDRILFTGLSSGNNNVYIVGGSTGAWTFTEDGNLATDGDALLIQEGTKAEDQYAFDGTTWVRIGGSLNNLELQYIRDFIGKTAAGIESPTYTAQNFISTGDNLEVAIDKLDQALGGNVTDGNNILSTNTINQNIQAIDSDMAFNHLETVLNGVTTQQAIDTIPVGDAQVVKWVVHAIDTANSKYFAAEVLAMHNGSGVTDLSVHLVQRIGGKINSIDFDADVSGGNFRLLVEAGVSVDFRAKRVLAW